MLWIGSQFIFDPPSGLKITVTIETEDWQCQAFSPHFPQQYIYCYLSQRSQMNSNILVRFKTWFQIHDWTFSRSVSFHVSPHSRKAWIFLSNQKILHQYIANININSLKSALNSLRTRKKKIATESQQKIVRDQQKGISKKQKEVSLLNGRKFLWNTCLDILKHTHTLNTEHNKEKKLSPLCLRQPT